MKLHGVFWEGRVEQSKGEREPRIARFPHGGLCHFGFHKYGQIVFEMLLHKNKQSIKCPLRCGAGAMTTMLCLQSVAAQCKHQAMSCQKTDDYMSGCGMRFMNSKALPEKQTMRFTSTLKQLPVETGQYNCILLRNAQINLGLCTYFC